MTTANQAQTASPSTPAQEITPEFDAYWKSLNSPEPDPSGPCFIASGPNFSINLPMFGMNRQSGEAK